jgi:hypothetical protein
VQIYRWIRVFQNKSILLSFFWLQFIDLSNQLICSLFQFNIDLFEVFLSTFLAFTFVINASKAAIFIN